MNIFETNIIEDFNYMLVNAGKKIKMNNEDKLALITNIQDKHTIRTNYPIENGQLIGYQNSNWLIIEEVDNKNDGIYRSKIKRCNHKIAFNFNGTVKWFDAIEESKIFDVDSGTYMSLPSGNINVTLQYNPDSKAISLDQRFYVTNQPFKVTGIDKSVVGLIKLNCKLDTISIDDDVENNIADRWKYETKHNYALTINNGDSADVFKNNTLKLNVSVTDNGATVTNPSITYISSDNSIASVENSGTITALSIGTTTITVQLADNPDTKDTITINVKEQVATHNYSVNIIASDSSSTLIAGSSYTTPYIAHVLDNNVEVSDQSVTWSICNVDNTTTPYASMHQVREIVVLLRG